MGTSKCRDCDGFGHINLVPCRNPIHITGMKTLVANVTGSSCPSCHVPIRVTVYTETQDAVPSRIYVEQVPHFE